MKTGSIINLSSVSWMLGEGDKVVYETAKSAVIGLTRSFAHEYGNYNRKCGNNESSNTWRVYLIKYNSLGSLEWEKTYTSNDGDWAGEDIDLTSDGGAIVAVDNGQFGYLKDAPF